MFLFFSVARSQEFGSWERATEMAQNVAQKSAKGNAKGSASFGMNMPLMSSAFDTAMWQNAA
jgi:hypothetical protein